MWCQYRTELTVERRVPRGAFMPRPEVESSLVTMSVLPAFELSEREESFMDLLSRALFTKRRKTILNGLSSLYPQKERLAQAIRTSGLNPSARPEELGVSGFLTLTRGLSSLGEPRPLSLPR